MFICLLYNSEVVLESQLTAQTEIIIVFGGQEGNLTICTQCIRNGDTQTCFTRELSVSLFAINGDNSRACLDVVGSSTNFSFIAYVDVGRSSGVVISNPTGIGSTLTYGPARAAPADMDRAAVAANTDLIICFYLVCLLAEWLPADERGIDNSPLYPFVTEITV